MTSQPSVLILGARGRFGQAAARAFAHAGWRVFAQMRPGAQPLAISGVQWIGAAPEDTSTLSHAAAGAQVVVQALSPVYTHKAWRTEVPALTGAAIAVTRALGAGAPPVTLMLPASVYNFGAAMPAVLHEDTPQAPTTFKGRLRQASEAQIRAATQDGGMRAVVIRAGDFFGAGAGSWLDLAIAKDLPAGKLTYPGRDGVPTAWAYLPDMARSFVQVAAQRHRLHTFDTLHFGGYALAREDWVSAANPIAREQGWLAPDANLRVRTLPWPLVRLMGLVVPTLAAISEMRYLWRTPHRLANARLTALIGAEPHTPFSEALRAALAERGMLLVNPAPQGAPALAAR